MSTRSNPSLAALADLLHHRWAVPVLATLHRERGAKFVTLASCLGVSRDSLRRTLAALTDQGLVRRNPGYGHPMRPEYVLTGRGAALGPRCDRLMQTVLRRGVADVCLRKWPLPVLLSIEGGAFRFSEIEAEVAGASPRAVALAVKELEAAGLIDREILGGYPPRTAYRVTAAARPLIDPLCELSRSLG
jgi:DNA-binding HxlR family transcriptional regulator